MISSHAKPSLRSLQVFEAAARRGSFTAAADELGITQSAVSRQVSDLEAFLGVRLFTRNGAKIAVAPAGDRLAAQLASSFQRVWTAVAEARRSDQVVTLSMLPSFAVRWFAPRLDRFLAANPDVDLRITASRHLVDFAGEGIDAAIRYSRQPAADLLTRNLGAETVQPVCSPGYAERLCLNAPEDLYRAVLLHGDLPEDWSAWLTAAGCDRAPPNGPRVGDDGAILQAAVEGQGVALGRSRLVADDLETGRLIAPFELSLVASHSYWFVRPKQDLVPPALDAVEEWLAEEFDGFDASG